MTPIQILKHRFDRIAAGRNLIAAGGEAAQRSWDSHPDWHGYGLNLLRSSLHEHRSLLKILDAARRLVIVTAPRRPGRSLHSAPLESLAPLSVRLRRQAASRSR